jgi:AraC-like DNA-binding protein
MKTKSSLPTHFLTQTPFAASDSSLVFGQHYIEHRINFYAIIWFTQDQDIHFIDFEAYPIKKNTVYLLGKNQIHAIPSLELPTAKVLVFSSDFFEEIEEIWLRQLFLPFDNNGIEIPESMVGNMENLFSLILAESSGSADQRLMVKYTSALLLLLHRFARFQQPKYNIDQRMMKLLHLIEKHFKEQKSVSFYAEAVGLSAKRINEILKRTANVNISQLCHQLLLVESKRALYHNILSIKEIAYELGFSDQSYFARFFKKQTGTTPEQFRIKEASKQTT